jgi:hypothetical protein
LLIEKIIQDLGLKLMVTEEIIKQVQIKFIQHQKLHNIQLKCHTWVDSIIKGIENKNSPCITIFDEAYVQMLLRNQGYEIQCHELNDFPKNSSDMIRVTYKNV